jgi:hypothetical protein
MDKDKKDIRKPTQHSMKRRSAIHNYFRPGATDELRGAGAVQDAGRLVEEEPWRLNRQAQ